MKKMMKFVKGKREEEPQVRSASLDSKRTSVDKTDESLREEDFIYRDKSVTKLHKAVWNENSDKLKSIIKTHDIDITDKFDRTALYFAVLKNNATIVNLLLENSANQNIPDIDGITPFLKSVQLGYKNCAVILLKYGADLKKTDKDLNTCLHFAVMGKNIDMLQCLLENNVDCNVPNVNGEYPLHIAVKLKTKQIVELLLHHDSDPNFQNANGLTSIALAKEQNSAELLTILLKHSSKTPVHVEPPQKSTQQTDEDLKRESKHSKTDSTSTDTWNDSPIGSPSKKTEKSLTKLSKHFFTDEVDLTEEKSESDVSVKCSENTSPQSGIIPPPCKPLRSLEYLQQSGLALETRPVHLLTLGTVRTRHISMTESDHSKSETPHRYSYQGEFHHLSPRGESFMKISDQFYQAENKENSMNLSERSNLLLKLKDTTKISGDVGPQKEWRARRELSGTFSSVEDKENESTLPEQKEVATLPKDYLGIQKFPGEEEQPPKSKLGKVEDDWGDLHPLCAGGDSFSKLPDHFSSTDEKENSANLSIKSKLLSKLDCDSTLQSDWGSNESLPLDELSKKDKSVSSSASKSGSNPGDRSAENTFLQRQFSILEDYEKNREKRYSFSGETSLKLGNTSDSNLNINLLHESTRFNHKTQEKQHYNVSYVDPNVSKDTDNSDSNLDDIDHLLEDNNRINAQLEKYAGQSSVLLLPATKSKSLPRSCEPCNSYHKGSFSLPRTLESGKDPYREMRYFKPRSHFFSLKMLKGEKRSGFIDKLRNMFNKKSQVHLTEQNDGSGTWLYKDRKNKGNTDLDMAINEAKKSGTVDNGSGFHAGFKEQEEDEDSIDISFANNEQNKVIEKKILSINNMSFEGGHSRKASGNHSGRCSREGCSSFEEEEKSHRSTKSLYSVIKKNESPQTNTDESSFCEDCSEVLNLKLVEAEQNIVSKEEFINLLQGQLAQLKTRNMQSINEAQDVYQKYDIATQELVCLKQICKKYDDELQRLRTEKTTKMEHEKDAIKLKEEAEKWRKQYEELISKINTVNKSTQLTETSKDSSDYQKPKLTPTDEENWRSLIQSEVSSVVSFLKENSQTVVTALENQNKKLETVVEKLQQDLENSARKQLDLQNELFSTKTELSSTKKQLGSKSNEKYSVAAETEETKTEVTESSFTAEIRRRSQGFELAELSLTRDELEKIKTQVMKTKKELEESKTELGFTKKELDEMKTQVLARSNLSLLKKEIGIINQELDKKTLDSSESTEESGYTFSCTDKENDESKNLESRSQNSDSKKRHEKSAQKAEKSQDKNTDDSFKTLQSTNKKLKKELDSMTKMYKELQNEYENNLKKIGKDIEKSTEFEVIKEEYQLLTRNLTDFTFQISEMKENVIKKNEELRNQIEELDSSDKTLLYLKTLTDSIQNIEKAVDNDFENDLSNYENISEQFRLIKKCQNVISDVEIIRKVNSDMEVKLLEIRISQNVSFLEEDNEKLKNTVGKQTKLIKNYESDFKVLENERREAKSEEETLKKQMEDQQNLLKAKTEKLEHEIEILKNNIEALVNRNESLKTEVEKLRQEKEHSRSKNENLRDEIETAKYKNECLRKEGEALKGEVVYLKAEYENAIKKNGHLKDEVENLKLKNENLQTKVDYLKNDTEILGDKIEALSRENENLKHEMKQLNVEKCRTEAELKLKEDTNQNQRTQISELNQVVRDLHKKYEALLEADTDLQIKFDSRIEETNRIQSEKDELQSDLRKAEIDNEEMKEKMTTTLTVNEDLKKTVGLNYVKIEELEAKNNELKQTVEVVKNAGKKSFSDEETLKLLQKSIEDEEKISEFKTKMNTLIKNYAVLTEQFEKEKCNSSVLLRRIDSLQFYHDNEMVANKSRVEELKAENENMKKKLEAELQKLLNEKMAMEDKLNSMLEDNEYLNVNIADLNKHISLLQEKLLNMNAFPPYESQTCDISFETISQQNVEMKSAMNVLRSILEGKLERKEKSSHFLEISQNIEALNEEISRRTSAETVDIQRDQERRSPEFLRSKKVVHWEEESRKDERKGDSLVIQASRMLLSFLTSSEDESSDQEGGLSSPDMGGNPDNIWEENQDNNKKTGPKHSDTKCSRTLRKNSAETSTRILMERINNLERNKEELRRIHFKNYSMKNASGKNSPEKSGGDLPEDTISSENGEEKLLFHSARNTPEKFDRVLPKDTLTNEEGTEKVLVHPNKNFPEKSGRKSVDKSAKIITERGKNVEKEIHSGRSSPEKCCRGLPERQNVTESIEEVTIHSCRNSPKKCTRSCAANVEKDADKILIHSRKSSPEKSTRILAEQINTIEKNLDSLLHLSPIKSSSFDLKSASLPNLAASAANFSAPLRLEDFKMMHNQEMGDVKPALANPNIFNTHSVARSSDTGIHTSLLTATDIPGVANAENLEVLFSASSAYSKVAKVIPSVRKSSSLDCITQKVSSNHLSVNSKEDKGEACNKSVNGGKWEKQLDSIQKLRSELTEIIEKLDLRKKGRNSPTETNASRYTQMINNLQKQVNELHVKSAQESNKCFTLQSELHGLKGNVVQKQEMENEIFKLRHELYKQRVERLQEIELSKIKKEAEIISVQQKLKDEYLRSKKKLLTDLSTVQNALQVKNEQEEKLKKKCDELVKEVNTSQEVRKMKQQDILHKTQHTTNCCSKTGKCIPTATLVPLPVAVKYHSKPESSYHKPHSASCVQKNGSKPHTAVVTARARLNSAIEKHRIKPESVPNPSQVHDEELKNKYLLK